jgi:hypothetical protein
MKKTIEFANHCFNQGLSVEEIEISRNFVERSSAVKNVTKKGKISPIFFTHRPEAYGP